MKKIYIFILLCLNSLFLLAQYSNINAALVGFGGGGVAASEFESSMKNQASWGSLKNINIGVGYNSRFMLKELSDRYLMFAAPLGKDRGVVGLNLLQFGYSQFSISKVGFGYGRNLWPNFSVGFQLDAISVRNSDEFYGKATAFTFEGGFQYRFNDKISLGTSIFNPVQSKLNANTDDKIPATLSLGVAYKPEPYLLISADIEKTQNKPMSLLAGFRYFLVKQLCIRAGFSTTPFTASGGVGVKFNNFTIDIATAYHQTLGMSPAITIFYEFEKK